VRDIEQFKRMNDLQGDEALSEGSISPEYPEEIDLRAEDDALIAAELEAAEIAAERAREEAEENGDEADEPVGSPSRRRRGATPARSRARSTTARRDTACGWTRPSRTIPSMPSTGRATVRSRWPWKRTGS
jgi:hypothetical protein